MICDAVPMEEESGGRRYRYWLHRELASEGRAGLAFVMLNPSTADAVNDDPTIRRCIGFGREWGFRELTVLNLFALRATKPAELRRHGAEAIGRRNDEALRWMREHPATTMVVAAWGNHGMHLNRAANVMAIIAPAVALGVTKQGCPKHPLYARREAKPLAYADEAPAAGRATMPGTPMPVLRAIAKLGEDVRDARRRRRIPMALLAERAAISRTTLANIERGDPGVSLGNYARALFSLGLIDRVADLADARHDDVGLAIEREKLPRRVRQRKNWR